MFLGRVMPALQWTVLLRCLAMSLAGGLGIYFGLGGFFELAYYRRRAQAAEWKCQPGRWPTPAVRRREILLGTANMTAASTASGLFVYHVTTGGRSGLYFDRATHGVAFGAAATLAYFLATDLALYWAHRLFHRPAAFRYVHRWHHRFTAPTAFSAV